jgi:ribonuclease HII
MIIGIDEVGRGAWAGPLAVGAVAIDPETVPDLTDSKKLSKKKRQFFAREIKKHAKFVGIGWVSAKKIDEIGISAALKLAAKKAMIGAPAEAREIIIDGTVRLIEAPGVTTLKKADLLIPAVSAAAIVAKVARDNYMCALKEYFSNYEFDKHVGYGTPVHEAIIDELGPCELHRMSFAPMSGIKKPPVNKPKTNTSGKIAEDKAAEFLGSKGFSVVDRNWKTKFCEVDIVAKKDECLHFVEVKYRKTLTSGKPIEYITPKKKRQMTFAAEIWRNFNGYKGSMKLSAIELEGENFKIGEFIEDIDASDARRVHTRQFGS